VWLKTALEIDLTGMGSMCTKRT